MTIHSSDVYILNETEIQEIKQSGRDPQNAQKQLELFAKGTPFLHVVRPAIPEDGINLMCHRKNEFLTIGEKEIAVGKVSKFVPASGAASRMFKALSSFADAPKGCGDTTREFVDRFFDNLDKFPFYDTLKESNVLPEDLSSASDCEKVKVLTYLLLEDGLNFRNLPKALLPFHRYKDSVKTSLEEQLVEGALYAADKDGVCRIAFTVSKEHLSPIRDLVAQKVPALEKAYGVHYLIDYTFQSPLTDTIAVTMENQPFLFNGSMFFRPGGHGALIENLNSVNSPFIVIKNIDNVCKDSLKPLTELWKKIMIGVASERQSSCNAVLQKLKKDSNTSALDEAIEFMKTINATLPPDFCNHKQSEKREIVMNLLDRPLRVCGMVKNQGEPGGGPFWVANESGHMSLQIVESSQIPESEREEVMAGGTHFNPVDLVVARERWDGTLFNLTDYIDEKAVFISQKSKDGRALKALELPGLWNGAMARYNTIFLDVPIETFNPVKTINDLLRPQHQS